MKRLILTLFPVTMAVLVCCSPRLINWKLDDTRTNMVDEKDVNTLNCNSSANLIKIGEVWGWDDDQQKLIRRAKITAGHFGWSNICVDKLEWVKTGTQTEGRFTNVTDNYSTYNSNTYNVGTYFVHAFVLKVSNDTRANIPFLLGWVDAVFQKDGAPSKLGYTSDKRYLTIEGARAEIAEGKLLPPIFAFPTKEKVNLEQPKKHEEMQSVQNQSGTSDRMHLAYILVFSKEDAEQIVKALAGGTSFEYLAKKCSVDTATASKGGDIGFVSLKDLNKKMSIAAQNLGIGEISKIIETENPDIGYCIVKRIE